MLPEASSLALTELLLEAGAQVSTHDPVALANAQRRLGDWHRLAWCHDPLSALEVADALVLATEWHAFRKIPPQATARALRDRIVIEPQRAAFAEAGLTLLQFGRPALAPREPVAEPSPRSGLQAAIGLPG